MTQSRYSICMTEEATEMPRCFSISIQSEVAWREALRPFTAPAIWIAPENSSSFSVSVVLPASGWEMMAKVRRRRTSAARGEADKGGGSNGNGRALFTAVSDPPLSHGGVLWAHGSGKGPGHAGDWRPGGGHHPSGQGADRRGQGQQDG